MPSHTNVYIRDYSLYDLLMSQTPAVKCVSMELVHQLHQMQTGATPDDVVELMAGVGEHYDAWCRVVGQGTRWLGIDAFASRPTSDDDYCAIKANLLSPLDPQLAVDYTANAVLLWFNSIDCVVGIDQRARQQALTQLLTNARLWGAPVYLNTFGNVLAGGEWPFANAGRIFVPYDHGLRGTIPDALRDICLWLEFKCLNHEIDWLHRTLAFDYTVKLVDNDGNQVHALHDIHYTFNVWSPAEIANAAYAAGFNVVTPYRTDPAGQLVLDPDPTDYDPDYKVYVLEP